MLPPTAQGATLSLFYHVSSSVVIQTPFDGIGEYPPINTSISEPPVGVNEVKKCQYRVFHGASATTCS